jgi:hypothetical protein
MTAKTYTLLGPDRQTYQSATPGALGGYRPGRVYGRLDCPAGTSGIACSSPTSRPPPRPGTGHAPCACPTSTRSGRQGARPGSELSAFLGCYIWDGNHSFEMVRRSKECVINRCAADLGARRPAESPLIEKHQAVRLFGSGKCSLMSGIGGNVYGRQTRQDQRTRST